MVSEFSQPDSGQMTTLKFSGIMTPRRQPIFCGMQDLDLNFHSVKADMRFDFSVNRKFFPKTPMFKIFKTEKISENDQI